MFEESLVCIHGVDQFLLISRDFDWRDKKKTFEWALFMLLLDAFDRKEY